MPKQKSNSKVNKRWSDKDYKALLDSIDCDIVLPINVKPTK